MNELEFEKIVDEQIEHIQTVLKKKALEYATSDRLHNFKVAAVMQGTTPEKALGGMLAKHIVSIYDLINGDLGVTPTKELWDEKIGDAINYLILLKAVVNDT